MTRTLESKLISYAQNREDVILHAILHGVKKGFYVDVGANHPVKESVTKHFYDHGWRGMNIEPSPRLHALLVADRPRDINLMVGVSNKQGELLFREYEHGDGLSTFSTEMQAMYEKSGYHPASKFKEYKVAVTTLADIFKEQKTDEIDFLKIDIEGYEYEALAGNDWQKYRPRVICIEANHIIKDWHDMLQKAGYTTVFFDGLNEYLIRREDKKMAEEFSYAEHILLAPPFVKWELHNEYVDANREKRFAQFRLERTESELTTCWQEVGRRRPASRVGDVKGRIKSLVRDIDRKIESRLALEPVRPARTQLRKIATASNETIAHEVKRSLASALEQQYGNRKQTVAHYYRKTRRFIASKRRRS